MKYYLLFFTLYLSIFSQDHFDDMMVKKTLSLRDYSINCSDLAVQFYKSNQIDSLYNLLDYWEEKVGYIEVIFRFKLLLDIENNTFSEQSYNKNIFVYLMNFEDRINHNQSELNPYDAEYFGHVPLNGEFDKLMIKIAKQLSHVTNLSALEMIFINYFNNVRKSRYKYLFTYFFFNSNYFLFF